MDQTGKLAIAIALSASLHAAVLLPVKATRGPQIATPRPQAFLSARLMANPAPLPEVPATPVSTPLADEPKEKHSPAQPEAVRHRSEAFAPPLDVNKPQPTSAAAATTPPPAPQSSGEHEGQSRPGVRVAKPEEVKVRVVLYAAGAEDNPNEIMDTADGKYVYFNAPRLKQKTHPIADATPHYPSAKLDSPHGAVMLLLQIDEAGKLEKTSVLCAHPAFRDSAMASIKDMRFGPAIDSTGPVKSYMIVEFGYGVGSPCGPPPHNLVSGKRPG